MFRGLAPSSRASAWPLQSSGGWLVMMATSIAVVKLARAGSVPLLTGYLQACGRNGGAAPAEAGWTLPALDTPRTRVVDAWLEAAVGR